MYGSPNGIVTDRRNETPRASDLASRLVGKNFVWGAGIECSFIPHLDVDQFEWTQHNHFWRDDFKRARQELGLTTLRYAFPWHVLEPRGGQFDWSLADERMKVADSLGIELYLDVMHFGTPKWLGQAAGDPEFPESLEGFAHALVSRYGNSIHTWCPCNEPLVLSLFSGDFGFWPPHSRKWRGYMPVLSRVVQAVSRAIKAIRDAQPEATVLLCDNVESYRSRDPQLAVEVRRRNLRRYLVLDLLTGRLDHHHALFNWVTSYGLSELDLEWFRAHPQSPDILGLDYYANSTWALEKVDGAIRQRRADDSAGFYGVASEYYNRYGLPMMLTETSIDGKPINRQIWLDRTIDACRRLRVAGVPMLGYFWWPLFDQVDWDGALTHRVGKIHEVGAFSLRRQADGTLSRETTPLLKQYAKAIASGNELVGGLNEITVPSENDEQDLPIGVEIPEQIDRLSALPTLVERPGTSKKMPTDANGHGNGDGHRNGNGHGRLADPAPGLSTPIATAPLTGNASAADRYTDRYGIVVFSHLRWGFVWQRPQQFLSRFARKHRILFVEEPFFDQPGEESKVELHQVMPNVIVVAPHLPPAWSRDPRLSVKLREFVRETMTEMNDVGDFDRPLLWYYSPMDSAWSLGHFPNRGIVYDCMDELAQFTGAPPALVQNEARLMEYADVVFTGGYELAERKRKQHGNVHPFGCGVEVEHFGQAAEEATTIPPDIDFMPRPILGWFGVVDERVNYAMVGEMARMRPQWSFAMVGPVVKVDPSMLPHSPNLFWLGGRDYDRLPNYCKAFDVCIMPFAINAATQFINPTKALEYMATGKPIVGTPVRDVVRQWTDIVRVAPTAEEFIQATEAAMRAGPDDERVKRGLELAARSSWDSTVLQLQELIRRAITTASRPSAKSLRPIPDEDLASAFVSTQGS